MISVQVPRETPLVHQDNGITLKVNAGYVQFYEVPKIE